MPIIQSAIKKLRKDRKRTIVNKRRKDALKEAVKKARSAPNALKMRKVVSSIDRAVKTHLIHKHKASRLKSKLAKLLGKKAGKEGKKRQPKDLKKTSKKGKTSS